MFCTLTHHRSILALSAGVCALTLAGGVEAKGKFVKFDPQHITEIHVTGISNAGVIAGYYNDGSYTHGFLRAADGTFTVFDPPGSQGTLVNGMNNKGVTVGSYDDPSGGGPAFVRNARGKYATFAVGNGAVANAVNDVNVTIGDYEDPVTGAFPGFIRDAHGGITAFDVVGDQGGTHPFGINIGGVITGDYYDQNDISHGFVRDAGGAITTIDYPGAVDTHASAINTTGTITGYYSDGTYYHGFLRSADGATFTPVDVPGDAGGTVATCINAKGEIAGYYAAQSGGASLGFVRTVAGKFTTIDPKNSQYTVPTSINSTRTVAGAASISGLNYGFLQSK